MRSAPVKIPTNLITGVLGAGKTTAIQSLLDQKPENERWAIVINEYGQVAIDNALLEHSAEIEVMELASGCACCTMSFAFRPLLAQLIRRVKPHRLIIEPSGAGHPARIIDMLRDQDFNKVLDLQATLCMVDPADFENPRIAESTLFNDQLHMSDVVVISWIDKRATSVLEACRRKIAALDPPKSHVYETSFGRLDISWLDSASSHQAILRYDPNHPASDRLSQDVSDFNPDALDTKRTLDFTDQPQASESVPPSAGKPTLVDLSSVNSAKPRRFENQGNGQWACGWIFPPHTVFDRDQVVALVEQLQRIRRAKGLFHCQDDWWAINRKGHESSLQPSSYRSDSRLEIIADEPLDWDTIEERLLDMRLG